MRYYEDLVAGEERLSGARQVTAEEIIEFARKYDPQYFHTDAEAAKSSIFGGLVASGIFTMAVWRQLDHQIAGDIAWICGVAWDDVKFKTALRAGDEVRARAQLASKRLSNSHPDRGVVICNYLLLNQRNETVFSCRSTNLVERKGSR
jgi:acyl dehydratase